MGWFDFISNPINDAWDDVVDSNPVTAGISEAVHDVGESTGINDVVDTVAPYAAALAVFYATGYLDPALLGATGMTEAELLAADALIAEGTAGVGAASAGAGAGAIGAEVGAGAGTGAGFVGPSSSLISAGGDAFLPGALAGDAAVGMPAWAQSALTGAGKGMLTNAGMSLLNGQPITPQGLILSGLSGGVGGGVANLTDSSWLGGLSAAGTNVLLNKSLNPAQVAGSAMSPFISNRSSSSGSGSSGSGSNGSVQSDPTLGYTPGVYQGTKVPLVGMPTFSAENTPMPGNDFYLSQAAEKEKASAIENAAEGGIMHYAGGGDVFDFTPQIFGGDASKLQKFTSRIKHPRTDMHYFDTYKEGGEIEEHNPEFYSEGGLNSIKHTYVTGDGDGTSDSIPAMLANGEFVLPADVVSGLGNGSNDAGAKILDEFLKTIRSHKRNADVNHLPPDSKGPLGYLLEAKKKAK